MSLTLHQTMPQVPNGDSRHLLRHKPRKQEAANLFLKAEAQYQNFWPTCSRRNVLFCDCSGRSRKHTRCDRLSFWQRQPSIASQRRTRDMDRLATRKVYLP